MVVKPSEKEEEYFIRLEAERLKKMQEEYRRTLAEDERRKLKELHFMHCPKCGQEMATTTLGGVEVEVCPGCRGVYLDDGELEKVTEERARSVFASALLSLRRIWKG